MFGRRRDTKRAGPGGDYKIPKERLGQTCSANPLNFHSRKSELFAFSHKLEFKDHRKKGSQEAKEKDALIFPVR